MGPSAASPEVGMALAEMVAEFPSLDVRIHNGVVPGINDRLFDGEFAFYVGSIPDNSEDIRFEIVTLAMIDLIVVASPLHPLAQAENVSAVELAQAAWIVIGNVEKNLPHWPKPFLAAGVPPPRPAINVRNVALVRNLLDQGKLITVLPKGMVQIDLAAGLLCSIAEEDFTWCVQLSAMFPRRKALSIGARILIEKLTRLFNSEAYIKNQ
jgi:LysR family transcriptional regulator of gallate degradation